MVELSETFYVGLYTFAGGFILAVLAVAYKIKFKKIYLMLGRNCD